VPYLVSPSATLHFEYESVVMWKKVERMARSFKRSGGKIMRSNIRDRNILFSGQDNSCLSFIAEAVAKKLLPPRTRVFSTSLKEDKIDPKALQVLREIGINASTQDAKGLNVIPTHDIDLIVMLGKPGEAQPTVSPRAKVTTWDIPDPCREPTPDLEAFRRARDEINKRVGGLFLDYWRNVA
jgi:arsenate reductase (thioredoxin)